MYLLLHQCFMASLVRENSGSSLLGYQELVEALADRAIILELNQEQRSLPYQDWQILATDYVTSASLSMLEYGPFPTKFKLLVTKNCSYQILVAWSLLIVLMVSWFWFSILLMLFWSGTLLSMPYVVATMEGWVKVHWLFSLHKRLANSPINIYIK